MHTSLKEKQIIAMLRQADAGASIPRLCAKYGVSKAMLDRWRAQYSNAVARQKTLRVKDLEGMLHEPGRHPVAVADMRVTEADT
ncbi:MAG: transposase [Candidimonas sp.]|nr:transposase [Candidimonas sp.]